MSGERYGEHIFLYFEYYENKEYIKGWGLNEDMCKKALYESFGDDVEFKRVIEESYAQWCPSRDECGDFVLSLQDRDRGGKGKFKVTIVEVEKH